METSEGPCSNAVLDVDGSALVECPYGGRAPQLVVEVFGEKHVVRGMCERCQADDDAAEAQREVERRERVLDRSMVGVRMRGWTLETLPSARGLQTAKKLGLEWLAGYRAGERRNLVLWGETGRGKTGLAWGLVRELALEDGRDVLLVNWRDLLAEMRMRIAQRQRGDADLDEMRARTVDVLALDDVGAERPTDFAREELAVLVEARYRDVLPTVVTTNYRPSELAARLGHDDVVIGQRIVSRLVEQAVQVNVAGSDLRVGT